MLSSELIVIFTGTVLLAITHTISPDHWFPFVMLGRANDWSLTRILLLATLAGIGHVGTSVVIGMMGVLASKELSECFADIAENATCILLMTFGFGYAIWALKRGGHHHGISSHIHAHDNGNYKNDVYEHLDIERHPKESHDDHKHKEGEYQPDHHDHFYYHDWLYHRHPHFHRLVKDNKVKGSYIKGVNGSSPFLRAPIKTGNK